VYYSDYIDTEDGWMRELYKKGLQKGLDLGERMHRAFKQQFHHSFNKVCIIGSDNPEISEAIINEAFRRLDDHDVVIGPSSDGGYYLLGLKEDLPNLFIDKKWSTDAVLSDTISILEDRKLRYFKLPVLSDIDTEEDLKKIKNNNEWKEF